VDPPLAHFTPVTLTNGVSLDYDHADDVAANHYAFLLSEPEFGAAFGRIEDQGITYYADPPPGSPARSTPATAAAAPTSATPTAT
jgi:hypothetical protein